MAVTRVEPSGWVSSEVMVKVEDSHEERFWEDSMERMASSAAVAREKESSMAPSGVVEKVMGDGLGEAGLEPRAYSMKSESPSLSESAVGLPVKGMESEAPGEPPWEALARHLEGRLWSGRESGLRRTRLWPRPSAAVGHGGESS